MCRKWRSRCLGSQGNRAITRVRGRDDVLQVGVGIDAGYKSLCLIRLCCTCGGVAVREASSS